VEWVWFFILTAAWTIPAGALLVLVMLFGPDAAKGKYKFVVSSRTEVNR